MAEQKRPAVGPGGPPRGVLRGIDIRPAVTCGGAVVDGAAKTSSAIVLVKVIGGMNGVMNNSGMQSIKPSERYGRRVFGNGTRFEALKKPPERASPSKKLPRRHGHALLLPAGLRRVWRSSNRPSFQKGPKSRIVPSLIASRMTNLGACCKFIAHGCGRWLTSTLPQRAANEWRPLFGGLR